ncbi:MAG: PP2C family protein-serine/threonine phosphatase [Gammaproteobacteria bacterium]
MKEDKKDRAPMAGTDTLEPHDFISKKQDLLTALPLFSGIPFHLLEPFFLKCEYRRLKTGDQLLSPGQANYYLYLLLSGQLTISFDTFESDKGIFVQPGGFVGEVSISDGLAPSAYVAATEESLILCIHETVLWSDFFQIPGAARNLLRQISGRIRERDAAIQKSVEQALRLEYLETELRIAQRLQASMLPLPPLFPKHPQVDVDALIKPAKEISGDFYDAFPLDSGRICIAIGDVAGKGVPSALFMVRSLTVLRTEMLKNKDLLQTIHAMNVALSRDNPTCMFLTLMICVVDVKNGRLQYVNGGHSRPVFGNFSDGFQLLKQPKGILIGIKAEAVYEIAARNLKAGDMLILYTDGVTEAMSPAQEEFTQRRLLHYVNQQPEQSADSMITGILNSVQDFASTAEQSDDLALLALVYHGR